MKARRVGRGGFTNPVHMNPAARHELQTLRDLIRYGVSRLNAAQVALGHGSDNAWDEAVYLTLHALHLPLDTLDPFLDARVLAENASACWT